jgi:hypothetical protein
MVERMLAGLLGVSGHLLGRRAFIYLNRSFVWNNLYYIYGDFRALYLEGQGADPELESTVVSVGIRRPIQFEERFPTLSAKQGRLNSDNQLSKICTVLNFQDCTAVCLNR